MGTFGIFNRFNSIGVVVITILCIAQQRNYAAPCPCDIYKDAGTPCVAAHSTVRALYESYKGPLYQVRRVSDNATNDITLRTDGIVDASVQETFLGTTAKAGVISIIYDQTGNGNDLKVAEVCPSCNGCPGHDDWKGKTDVEAYADGAKIVINGYAAYGVRILPCDYAKGINQTGYRVKVGKNIPTGDQPEGEYMVVDGVNTNASCCFDYGNASTNLTASGNMSTIEFLKNKYWGYGAGSGPWVTSDLEAGVYSWGGSGLNSNSISLPYPFVTAIDKNNSSGKTPGPFTLKGGDARSGKLTTMWEGARPNGYTSLKKQGGLVLGIGGDNAAGAAGSFFEGAITAGVCSNATDDKLQENIVAAGYGRTTTLVSYHLKSAPGFTVHYNQSTTSAAISYTLQKTQRV